MKNKIKTVVGAVISALCFLTVFFGLTVQVRAESGQLLHRHTGSRQDGGGCYGTRRVSTYTCGSYNINIWQSGTKYIYLCGQCGNEWSHSYRLDGAQCAAEITSAYYELDCGKSGAAAVSFACEKSTQGWTKELDLTASHSVHEEGISISGYLWNGSPGGASCHVTENGTYTLGLTGSGNVDFSPTVSVIVDHIDNTAPVIDSFQVLSDTWGSSAQLQVCASDTGAGLASEAYSYDGGVSWNSSDTYMVSANGTYQVRVRDAVGNVSTAQATVDHIDCEPPAVSVSTSPSTDNWYDGSLTVIIHAQDAGSGLNDAPYSFDGGATYLVGNSATLSGSGTLEIAVMDRAGNVARLSFHAEKKQRPQPTPGSAGNGGGSGNTGSGTGNSGSGNAGSGTGNSGNGNAGSSTGAGGIGSSGSGNTGSGGLENAGGGTGGSGETGAGGAGKGESGTNQAGTGGTAAGSPGDGGTETESGKGAGVSSIGGGAGSGTGNGTGNGGSGSGKGNGGTGVQGNNYDGGNGAGGSGSKNFHDNGKQRSAGENGLSGAARGSGKDDPDRDGNAQSEMTGTLPQHYPGGLPRVDGMTGSRQDENGQGSRDGSNGTNGTDGADGAEGAGMNGTESADGADGAGGADGMDGTNGADDVGDTNVEETIIQNELLASANGQEAAVLQRTGGLPGVGMPFGSTPVLAVCAAVLAAAVLLGWCLLFGVRIDTKDEKGHYRFAGMTRVTRNEQERLRVVPLTRQIIRNSHTNELRVRFGLLCCKRYEGETLLLRYRSMKREFKAQRTVELHIRA